MQIVVLMATQKSHSGFSTYTVKSVGKHTGTAGLKSRKRSQQLDTAVSMLRDQSGTCMRRKHRGKLTTR